MLRATHQAIAEAPEQYLKNALIESFCVHARALLDFYIPKRKRDDDVVATDFVESGHFPAIATSQIPEDIRLRVNKQIAHLTAARENATKIGGCDRQKLFAAIEQDHLAFKSAVDPKYADCFARLEQRATVNSSTPSATNSSQCIIKSDEC